jgi:Ssp1 endopeptidase immunity protein Rap1a
MRRCAVIVAAMIFTTTAHAEAPNAAEVLRACATASGAPTDTCKAYINGLMAGIYLDQTAREHDDPICLPDRLTTEDVIAAITAFIAAHPITFTVKADPVIGVAIQAAYPCKR